MKRLNQVLRLPLLIALAVLAGCDRSSAPNERALTGDNAAPQAQQPSGGTMPQGQTKFFTGSIGATQGLQMKLVREGESLTGSYFYQRVGTAINLRGTIDKDGRLVLAEFDPSGKQSESRFFALGSNQRETPPREGVGISRKVDSSLSVATSVNLHPARGWHLSESRFFALGSNQRESPPREGVASLGNLPGQAGGIQ